MTKPTWSTTTIVLVGRNCHLIQWRSNHYRFSTKALVITGVTKTKDMVPVPPPSQLEIGCVNCCDNAEQGPASIYTVADMPRRQPAKRQMQPKKKPKQQTRNRPKQKTLRLGGQGLVRKAAIGMAGALATRASNSGWGKRITNWAGRIFGQGDYKVISNTLASGPPTFDSDGSMVIAHREFLGDVSGSTSFTNTPYTINPGVSTSYPWLSLLAEGFDQYQILGQVYEFKSTSANALNSTNTALGTVIMATTYDPLDPFFTNKIQMEAYQYSTSCKPSESTMHLVECNPGFNSLKNYYVRHASLPVGADARFHDMGVFQIATTGMQAAAVIGELWVSYHVKFHKPKLSTPFGANLTYCRYTTTPTLSGFLLSPVKNEGSLTLANMTGTTFVIPGPGAYMVVFEVTSTTVVGSADFTFGTGAAGLTLWSNGSAAITRAQVGSSFFGLTLVITPVGGASVTLAVPSSLTGSPVGRLFVMQIPSLSDHRLATVVEDHKESDYEDIEPLLRQTQFFDDHHRGHRTVAGMGRPGPTC